MRWMRSELALVMRPMNDGVMQIEASAAGRAFMLDACAVCELPRLTGSAISAMRNPLQGQKQTVSKVPSLTGE